jgi:hypothetical protein
MSKYLGKQVIKSAIAELLSHGFSISVNDGKETTLVRALDADAIFGAMMTTDERTDPAWTAAAGSVSSTGTMGGTS